MRKMLIAAVFHFPTSADGSTVFVVQGSMTRNAKLAGTITIDTIAGTLDAVDLYVAPIDMPPLYYGDFPTTLHYTTASLGYQFGRTFIGSTIIENIANGRLELTLDVPTLIGYAGGPIKPTQQVTIFWSGLIVQSQYEYSQIRYYPISSGSLAPLVVPEPGTFAMGVMGVVALMAGRDAAVRPELGSACEPFWVIDWLTS